MADLAIVHRTKQKNTTCGFDPQFFPLEQLVDSSSSALWATCLREIFFVSKEHLPEIPNCEVYTGIEAIQFLLEIVCGLHSPVFGETEVMGQFKTFLETEFKKEGLIFSQRRFFQNILADAKAMRAEYLQNLGGQTYGSLCRRLLSNRSTVAMLGAGQLANELAPWLEQKKIEVFSRHPETAVVTTAATIKSYSDLVRSEVLIIAAPLTNKNLLSLIERSPEIKLILDWRGEGQLDKLSSSIQYFSFTDLMKQLESEKDEHAKIKKEVLIAVQKIAHRIYNGSVHRPLGWDDICA